MLNLKQFSHYFTSISNELQKKIDFQKVKNVLALQAVKKKLKVVQNDFMKMQNRSKLITVDPIFNRKEYLGINTEPLPVERYLIEIGYP